MSSKSALIIGTNGCEETELLITSNILRRGGVEVTIASQTNEKTFVSSRKASINADKLLNEIQEETFDAVILPGGLPGSETNAQDANVGKLLKRHYETGKIVAAICAGPLAIKSNGIAPGATITSYPALKDKFEGYEYSEDKVCVWNNLVTSRGPGTTFDFAFKILEILVNKEKVQEVRKAVLLD